MNIRHILKAYTRSRALTVSTLLLLLIALLFTSLAGTTPAYAAPLAQGGVQRIRFAPGATGTVVNGNVAGEQVARYVLTALAGQTMTVQPYSDGAPVFVTILDTTRAVLGSTSSGEQWSGRLPATGDYALAVYPSPYTANTGYQLRIEITNSSTPAPAPERIRFASGATSAQVNGNLPTASSKLYVLGARAGQIMTIESYTSSGPFRFTVSEANGASLGSGNQGDSWSGTLPRTGDYNLTLQSPMDASPANYALRITIVNAAPAPTPTPAPPPPAVRISFPQGATSVTLTGYVDSYSPARYVLRALSGQTMTIDLNTLYGHHTNITVRDQQGNFLGAADGGEAWSGNLPYTGDYYLEVQAPPDNPGDLFSLRVEIRW